MTDLKRQACLIDGAWIHSEAWIDVENPATGETIGRVPSVTTDDVSRAIEAARAAMPAWAAATARHRATILRRFFDLMVENADDLAQILTEEQGKPLREAHGEILYAASFLEWYAEEAGRVYGDVIPSHAEDKRLVVLKQPIGVVAAITPWNFPSAMVTRKIGPALAAGCSVILKPAELTPFSALALGVLAERAGIPAGVLNIVTGASQMIGEMLTESPVVRKISFTGSTAVGSKLYAQSAPTIKKLSLELGGNAPFIVFDDADLDQAVAGAVQSKFRNAGQTCVCTNRFIVQAGIHDAFVEQLVEAVNRLKVAPGSDADADIGPLINGQAIAKVKSHIDDALDQGGRLETGGDLIAPGTRFFKPTVISGVTPDMLVATEETFGPLAAIIKFEAEKDAIDLANATEVGLASYVYSRDLARVWRVAEALETGMVGVNTGLISTAVAPFGGIKSSGLGREGSRYGMEDYLEVKYLCIDIGD
jgi:succinate-semialdehyde dehydrogenase/glutarate-semialdehyde dehydrogenase